jgi:phosphoribosyl-dephospho-CoA transferase
MYSRHDLVWLSAEGWHAAAGRSSALELDAIGLWRREDWPAIVRRNDIGAGHDTISLGLALPPDPVDGSKRRIALRANRSHVVRHAPPLPLAQAIASAPNEWRAGLAALDAGAAGYGLRGYGSLALQAITARRYLTGRSDIDLLFRPATIAQLGAGIDLLSSHAVHLPLDGEVVFPSGDAVAWKEWRDAASRGARVLAKSIDAVRLLSPASLLATLGAG